MRLLRTLQVSSPSSLEIATDKLYVRISLCPFPSNTFKDANGWYFTGGSIRHSPINRRLWITQNYTSSKRAFDRRAHLGLQDIRSQRWYEGWRWAACWLRRGVWISLDGGHEDWWSTFEAFWIWQVRVPSQLVCDAFLIRMLGSTNTNWLWNPFFRPWNSKIGWVSGGMAPVQLQTR